MNMLENHSLKSMQSLNNNLSNKEKVKLSEMMNEYDY